MAYKKPEEPISISDKEFEDSMFDPKSVAVDYFESMEKSSKDNTSKENASKSGQPTINSNTASDIENLELITKVFQQIEAETAQVAEMLFDYLIEATDAQIMTGTIPAHNNRKINEYVKIMNRLFKFSRAASDGGFRLITRNTIQALDKKTYTISMCHDGGTSLDILCDIVNSENSARTPRNSVKIKVVKQLAPASLDKSMDGLV
jgi:hypothetical protein